MALIIQNLTAAQLKKKVAKQGYIDPTIKQQFLPAPSHLEEAFRKCAAFLVQQINASVDVLIERREMIHRHDVEGDTQRAALDKLKAATAKLKNLGEDSVTADFEELEEAWAMPDEFIRSGDHAVRIARENIIDFQYALEILQTDYRNLTKSDQNLSRRIREKLAFETYADYMGGISRLMRGKEPPRVEREEELLVDAVPMFFPDDVIARLALGKKVKYLKTEVYEIK